jgi:lysophospholipase L1-like esterase
MHFQGKVDVHGAAELRSGEREGAVRVQRVPEQTRVELNPGAQRKTLDPANVEIRFVLEEGEAELTLSSNAELHASVFFGNLDSAQRFVVSEKPGSFQIGVPPVQVDRLQTIAKVPEANARFSVRVVRVLFHGEAELYLHEAKGAIRPPRPDELPERTLLTYGTSITQWANATAQHLTWPAQCAWRLGTDLVNLGVSGSCHVENAFADHIAGRSDWDIGVFPFSVNMVGGGFSLDEFESRVRYFIERLIEHHAEKPMFFITLFRYFADWGVPQENAAAGPDEFRKRLRIAVGSYNKPYLTVVDGLEMLPSATGLSADLIHPSDLGMITIGERVAGVIRATEGPR